MKKIILLGALAIVCLGAAVEGTLIQYRNGTRITVDTSFKVSDEDGKWSVNWAGMQLLSGLGIGNGQNITNIQDTVNPMPPLATTSAVFAGDSITAGYIIGITNSYNGWITNSIANGGQGWTFGGGCTNTAIVGQFSYGLLTNYQQEIGQFAPATGNSAFLFLLIGVNDVDLQTNTLSTFQNISNICLLAHSNAFTVVLMDIPDNRAAGLHDDMEQRRTQINQWLAKSLSMWDYFVPVSQIVPDPVVSPTWFVDGIIHWSTWANENVIAPRVVLTLRRSPHTQYSRPAQTYSPFITDFANITNGNYFIGSSGALTNTNITGINNYFAGIGSGVKLTSGSNNYSLGGLNSLTTGSNNFSAGQSALALMTAGYENVAVGMEAMQNFTNGHENEAFGWQAMIGGSGANGSANAAFGEQAVGGITSGYNNVGFGNVALQVVTSGFDNTASGNNSFVTLTTGNDNTGVGYNVGNGLTTGSSNNVSGKFPLAAASTSVVGMADGAGNIAFQVAGLGQPLSTASILITNNITYTTTNTGPTFVVGTTAPKIWIPFTNGTTVFYMPGY